MYCGIFKKFEKLTFGMGMGLSMGLGMRLGVMMTFAMGLSMTLSPSLPSVSPSDGTGICIASTWNVRIVRFQVLEAISCLDSTASMTLIGMKLHLYSSAVSDADGFVSYLSHTATVFHYVLLLFARLYAKEVLWTVWGRLQVEFSEKQDHSAPPWNPYLPHFVRKGLVVFVRVIVYSWGNVLGSYQLDFQLQRDLLDLWFFASSEPRHLEDYFFFFSYVRLLTKENRKKFLLNTV